MSRPRRRGDPLGARPPSELNLPAPRTHAAVAQLGRGSSLSAALTARPPRRRPTSPSSRKGALGAWAEGPALPEARTRGLDRRHRQLGLPPRRHECRRRGDGHRLGPLGRHRDVGARDMGRGRGPRRSRGSTNASAIARRRRPRDGRRARAPDGAPTKTVWKADVDVSASAASPLKPFEAQAELLGAACRRNDRPGRRLPVAYGGSDADGPGATVQRGNLDVAADARDAGPATPRPAPLKLLQWAIR